MKHLFIVVCLAIVSLTACTDDGSATKAKEKEATVFDSQLNALDKTRNIENVLHQNADQRQNNLDVE
ncbi:MAG: hypothetical protein KBT50_00900 [Cycloclasticus sp.]|nr:hypothetical protein [Cycloclasticus sp.]MBQ0789149.1 hypothetical protein [Cycloclasticus sp.]